MTRITEEDAPVQYAALQCPRREEPHEQHEMDGGDFDCSGIPWPKPAADVGVTSKGEPPFVDEDPARADQRAEAHVVLTHVLENMAQAVLEERTQQTTPQVVTLCGSTRFRDHFEAAERAFTRKGIIVLTVGGYWSREEGSLEAAIGDEDAQRVYHLHLDKISMSDAVVLLDVGGYEGETTRVERLFATQIGIPVLSYAEWTTRAPLSQAPAVVEHEHSWYSHAETMQYRCAGGLGLLCPAMVTWEEATQAGGYDDLSVPDQVRFLSYVWKKKQEKQ